jgi:hypothetical protein
MTTMINRTEARNFSDLDTWGHVGLSLMLDLSLMFLSQFYLPNGFQVSNEVQKLRDYEAALMRSYQSYLKILVAALNKDARGPAGKHGSMKAGPGAAVSKSHARIAIKCMCQLLSSIPHFNYT